MIVLHWAREALAVIAEGILTLLESFTAALAAMMMLLITVGVPLWLLYWLIRFVKYAWEN